MRKIKIISCLPIFFPLLCPWVGKASILRLSFDDYLQQVSQKDSRLKSVQLAREGSELILGSGQLLTNIQLTSQISFLDDERPTASPTTTGNKIENKSYNLGFQQQTSLGLNWTLTQNVSETTVLGANPLFLPQNQYFDTYPKIEVQIPLWRNWLGRETRARVENIDAQAKAQKLQNQAEEILARVQVEITYSQLLSQKEILEIHKDNLRRAEKILESSRIRVQRNLSDRSDLYQAEAAIRLRRLELLNAEKQLREVSLKFNQMRGLESDTVAEELTPLVLNIQSLDLSNSPPRFARDNLAQIEVARSQAALSRSLWEQNKPNLNLSLSHLKMGRDRDYSLAQQNMLDRDNDYWLIALQFSMPLDQEDLQKQRQGHKLMAESQTYKEKALHEDQNRIWMSTVNHARWMKSQMTLLRELEDIQLQKADLERVKLSQGRSTIYQVLMFEQDFVNVRSQKVHLELQIRQFISQLTLFTEEADL